MAQQQQKAPGSGGLRIPAQLMLAGASGHSSASGQPCVTLSHLQPDVTLAGPRRGRDEQEDERKKERKKVGKRAAAAEEVNV